MKKNIASLALALSMAMPYSAMIYANTEETEPVKEEQKDPAITTIDSDQKEQEYTLDSDKIIVIGNEAKDLVLKDCTFRISGTTNTDADPMSREMKSYFKVKVFGNVTFENCTFITSGQQSEDSITDANLFLEGDEITFKKCSFEAKEYVGRYIGAYQGKIDFIDSKIDVQKNVKQPAITVTEAALDLEDSSVKIEQATSEQPMIYANAQDQGSISLNKKSTIVIENNDAAAMELNATPIDLDSSSIKIVNNASGITGGNFDLKKKSELSIENNRGLGLALNGKMTIDDSSVSIQGNQGTVDSLTDVNTLLSGGTIEIKDTSDVTLGSLVNQDGKITPLENGEYTATLLDPAAIVDGEQEETPKEEPTKEPVKEPDQEEPKQEPTETIPEAKTYSVTIRYINAQNEEDLGTAKIPDLKENSKYNASDWINIHIPEAFKLVSTKGETEGTLKGNIEIIAYIQPINEYFVRVNYYDETTNQPIHYSNQIPALSQGSSWDVERFDRLEIKGYEYVKTVGEVKGENITKDQIVDVYYKKIETGAPSKTDKNDKNQNQAVNTSTKTNEGLYITLGAIALAAIILLVVRAFQKKHKEKK